MVFTFLENALNLDIFTHEPVPHSKLLAEFFENLFPPTAERGGENYDLLYQNSIRKYDRLVFSRFFDIRGYFLIF